MLLIRKFLLVVEVAFVWTMWVLMLTTMLRGSIETPLMHKRNALEDVDQTYHPTPINRLGTSEECGNLIAWLLSDESKFVSGATYAIDGGWAC
jgi:NAD(P)-dependent dehydrogenase (short-subunit alcohol dehydrogenase family)